MSIQDVNSYKTFWKLLSSINPETIEREFVEDVPFVSLKPIPSVGDVVPIGSEFYLVIYVESTIAKDEKTGYLVASARVMALNTSALKTGTGE